MPIVPIQKNRAKKPKAEPKRTLTLAGVDFASDEAAELAAKFALIASDFEGVEHSGKHGYTVADVKRIAGEFAE